MDLFKEDKELLKSGAYFSAFKWALFVFPVIFVLNVVGIVLLAAGSLLGLFFLVVFPNIVFFLVCFFSLKKSIKRFNLNTYSLRLGYVSVIFISIIAFTFFLNLILTGELSFPKIGIISIIILLAIPYFVNK